MSNIDKESLNHFLDFAVARIDQINGHTKESAMSGIAGQASGLEPAQPRGFMRNFFRSLIPKIGNIGELTRSGALDIGFHPGRLARSGNIMQRIKYLNNIPEKELIQQKTLGGYNKVPGYGGSTPYIAGTNSYINGATKRASVKALATIGSKALAKAPSALGSLTTPAAGKGNILNNILSWLRSNPRAQGALGAGIPLAGLGAYRENYNANKLNDTVANAVTQVAQKAQDNYEKLGLLGKMLGKPIFQPDKPIF